MSDLETTEQLAERLLSARRDGRPIGMDDARLGLPQAYAIQQRLAELSCDAGAAIVGWKVGLTSERAMAMFGASEPIAGPIFNYSVRDSGATIEFGDTIEARVEGEILIEIGVPPSTPFTDAQLMSSIASLRPAIEIADSRIVGWPDQAAPAIADDACCGWIIAGAANDLSEIDLAAIEMRLTADGLEVGKGLGANCMGNPLNVYRWFVEKAASLGWNIEPGQLLLTGAIAPPVPARAGTHYEATLTRLGRVEFSFGENRLV